MKKTISLLTLLVIVLSAVPALAVGFTTFTSLDNIGTSGSGLSGYLTDITSTFDADGLWDVTPLYKEASHTDHYGLMDGSFSASFSNTNIAADFGDFLTVDLSSTGFVDTSAGSSFISVTDTSRVKFFSVTNPFYFMLGGESILLDTGFVLFGFNDIYGDCDFDDFVLAATPAHTPIPGAVWLLGTGLLGLLGLRGRIRG